MRFIHDFEKRPRPAMSKSIARRLSAQPAPPSQAPTGKAAQPSASTTTLTNPTPSKAGPPRTRMDAQQPATSALKTALRKLSAVLAGALRGATGADRATKAWNREANRTLDQLVEAKAPGAIASALKSLAKAHEQALANDLKPGLLQACLETAIVHLSYEDLGKLMRGLDSAAVVEAQGSLANDEPARRQLMTIKQLAIAQVRADAMDKLQEEVGEKLLGSIRGPDAIDNLAARARISGVFRHAEQSLGRLAEHGVPPLAPHEVRERAEEEVLNALASEPEEQYRLLACMSSADLHRLAAAAQRLPPHELAAPLAECIAERGDFLAGATKDACELLLSHAPSAADVLAHDGKPPHIDEVLQYLDELEAHCKLSGTAVPEAISRQLAQARTHVSAALAAGSEQLVSAGPAELRRVAEATHRLGMDEAALHPLRAAATKRSAHLQADCFDALDRMLAGMRASDPVATLRHLAQLEALTHDFADASAATGPRQARGRADIANEEISQILRRFPQEQLTEVLEQLRGSFGRDLLATLQEASSDELSPPEALARLTLVAAQLEQLPDQIAAALAGEQRKAPGFETARTEIPLREAGAEPLPMNMRQAVRDVLGVDAPEHGDEVRRGIVNGVFRQRFEEVLAEPAAAMERTPVRLPSGLEVSQGFLEDAKRRFDFRLPDGSPLIDYADNAEAWGRLSDDERMQRIDAGAQRLLALYGGRPHAVFVATSRAFQSSTAPLQIGAAAVSRPGQPAQGNPARLPDGTHGYACNVYWTSEQSKSITFLRGANGRPQLLVDYRHRGGALELADAQPGSQPLYLDPQKSSMRLRAHVEFLGPVGQLRALGVPSYEVHLVRHTFQKPYPPPTMQTLFANNGFDEYAARTELEAHAVGRGRGGVVPAVRAIDAFVAESTLEAAEAVLAANRPQAKRGEKMQAACAVVDRATGEKGPALVACFDRARAELVDVIRHRYPGDKAALRARPDWPQDMEPPESYDTLLGTGSPEAIKAYHAYLRAPTLCPEFVEFSEALDGLGRSPSVANARALYERWVKPEPTGAMDFGAPGQLPPQHGQRLNLRAHTARAVLDAIDQLARTQLDPGLFDEARTELGTIIDLDLAPAFTADVIAGRA